MASLIVDATVVTVLRAHLSRFIGFTSSRLSLGGAETAAVDIMPSAIAAVIATLELALFDIVSFDGSNFDCFERRQINIGNANMKGLAIHMFVDAPRQIEVL